MIADMMADIDAGRFLAYRAFFLLGKGVRCYKECSLAKAFCTEAAVRVTSKAIQIHGAYGLSEEYPVERYFQGCPLLYDSRWDHSDPTVDRGP